MYKKICGLILLLLIIVSAGEIHYYDGETPPSGTKGKLVRYYDGCNYHSIDEWGLEGVTCVGCNFQDGQVINTWKMYQVSDTLYVVIHDKHIYKDPNIKEW